MMAKRQLNDMQKAFLKALGDEAQGDIRKAMDIAGYSRTVKPDYIYGTLTEEIVEVATKLLASQSMKAVFNLMNVMDNPEQLGAKNRLNAIKEILDRAGIVKAEKLQIESTNAVAILPDIKERDEDD